MDLNEIIIVIKEDYRHLRNRNWGILARLDRLDIYGEYCRLLYEYDVDIQIQNYARHLFEFYSYLKGGSLSA